MPRAAAALWVQLQQAALSKPLAETACLRAVISYNLCVGWFAKIRKKYIPELEHLWPLYHYCIF